MWGKGKKEAIAITAGLLNQQTNSPNNLFDTDRLNITTVQVVVD